MASPSREPRVQQQARPVSERVLLFRLLVRTGRHQVPRRAVHSADELLGCNSNKTLRGIGPKASRLKTPVKFR